MDQIEFRKVVRNEENEEMKECGKRHLQDDGKPRKEFDRKIACSMCRISLK